MRTNLEEVLNTIFPVDLDLVAFDPGETTGVVSICKGKAHGYTVSEKEMVQCLYDERWSMYKTWVHEKFLLYPWRSQEQGFSDMVAARIIGMLQLASFSCYTVLYSYTAQQGKSAVTDEWFDILGWDLKNKHIRDAGRQAALHQLNFYQKKLPKPLTW